MNARTLRSARYVVVAICIELGLTLSARAEEPAPIDAFHFNPTLDGIWVGAGLVLWVTPALLQGAMPGPSCDPCSAQGLNALDRTVLGNDSAAARLGANLLAGILPTAAAMGTLTFLPEIGWRGVIGDAALIAESAITSGVVNQVVAYAVRRPRPFMYVAGLRPDQRGQVGAMLSFYSGHASNVFAALVSFSYIYAVRRPHHWSRWVVLAAAIAAGSVEPVLRVLGGDHFWTDGIVGSALGSAFGILVPLVHRQYGRTIAIRPTFAAGGAQLAVGVNF